MFGLKLGRSLQATRSITPASLTSRPFIAAQRPFHAATRLQAAKGTQHKDSINTESNEYSKSGSDDASAAVEDTAFSRDKTSPEEQHDHAGSEAAQQGEKENNPLDVSPANTEVSKPRGQQEGGAEGSAKQEGSSGSSGRDRTSGGGSGPKSGGGKYGGSGSGS